MELETITPFTPLASTLGGVLIGLSAVMVMALFGRISGISGITTAVLSFAGPKDARAPDIGWRLAFLLGLIAAPLVYTGVWGQAIVQTVPVSLTGMGIAGLVVGLGTAIGSGCTSGHGVCGLARLSPRSLVAVLTFMLAAGVTVFVLRHAVGG